MSHLSSAALIRNKLFPTPSNSAHSSRYNSPMNSRPNAPPIEEPHRYTYRPDNSEVVSDRRGGGGYAGINDEPPMGDEWSYQPRRGSPPRGTTDRRWWDESGNRDVGGKQVIQRRAPPSDDGYGDSRFGQLAGDVSTTADLHRAMRDMEMRKDQEIEQLRQEVRRKDQQITSLEEAVHVAVRALDAEAATASYLSHTANRRDTQSLFWHWRCRYLTRMNKKLGTAILDLHKLLNASVTISSVVHENKKAAVSKSMAELAAAEGNLASCRASFFQAMSNSTSSPAAEGRRLTAAILSSPHRAASSQSLGRMGGDDDDVISALSDETDPTPTNHYQASPKASRPEASAEEVIADVADRYRILAQEYADEMEHVVQCRMGVVCTNINAAFDQYNITNHVLGKLAVFAELAEGINPLLKGDAMRAAANAETDKALSQLQESKGKTARDEVAAAVGVDVDFASLLNMPDTASPRRPKKGGLDVVSPSLLAHTASIDIHRDAHHALVATTALPPLINLLKAGVHTLTPALAKAVQNGPSTKNPIDYLPLAVSTITTLFYDSLEQSMVRAPMTAVHDMLLRRWMDHHLRLPGSGSEKGPDGKPISALDDKRHHTIADGDFSKEVKLPDVSLFIQPLVKDGGSFGDTMRRVRQQHAQQQASSSSPQRIKDRRSFDREEDVQVVREANYPYAVKRVHKDAVSSSRRGGEDSDGYERRQSGRDIDGNGTRNGARYVQGASAPNREDELDEAATRLADAMLLKKTSRNLQHKFEGVGGFSSTPLRHLMHVMSRSSPPRHQTPTEAPYLRPESIRRFGSSTVLGSEGVERTPIHPANTSTVTSLGARDHPREDATARRGGSPIRESNNSALRFCPPNGRPKPASSAVASTLTPVSTRQRPVEHTDPTPAVATPRSNVSPVRGRHQGAPSSSTYSVHQQHQQQQRYADLPTKPSTTTDSNASSIYLFEGTKSVSPGQGLQNAVSRTTSPAPKDVTASMDVSSEDMDEAEEFRSLASAPQSAQPTPRTSGSPSRRQPSAFRRPQPGDDRPVSPSPRLPTQGRREIL